MALPSPFPDTLPTDTLYPDAELQKILDVFGQKALVTRAGFAIADLTRYVSPYAVWNPNALRFSGSVVKIAAMFAAYQLRERVRLAAQGLKKDALFRTITSEWYRTVARAVTGPENFPALDEIFTPRDGGVEFTKTFQDNIHLMISKSDTTASGKCIRALGHQYINGALARAGLYSADRGGIWLGGDYNNIEYQHVAGDPTHYATTPMALLRFLDLLNTGELVSPAACDEMKSLMDNFYTTRFLKDQNEGFLPAETFGKLGWETVGSAKSFFDAGAVRRVSKWGVCRYAIVMLGLPFDVLNRLALVLDEVIVKWHFREKPPMVRHTFE